MKPNILFITSDQHRADAFGFENSELRTPHLDSLASEGTRFSACITPNLVCQPSRASILTGLLPLTHGVYDNGVDLDPAIGEAGFAGRLNAAGYRTAIIGKAHFSSKNTFQPSGTPECRSSTALYDAGWMGPYMGFGHAELANLGKMYPQREISANSVGHWERWLARQGEEGDAHRRWLAREDEGTGAAQTWKSGLPAAWHSTTWTADRAIRWLTQEEKSDQPFCLWVSFADPHHPFDCPAPWNRLYDPQQITLPKHRTLDLELRPWWHRATLEGEPAIADAHMRKFRSATSRVPAQSDAQLAEMTANYYGMISQIDHNVGRLLVALDDSGRRRETLVVFTTDHGEMLGNHGLYLKGPTPYEDLLRVQLIVQGLGAKPGLMVEEPVSTLDLAPTFLDAAGTAIPAVMQGQSLLGLARGEPEHRAAAYSEWQLHPSRCGVALQLRTVRTRRYKCTFELISGAGELYDLVDDPREMVNRYDDPKYVGVRAGLQRLLQERPGVVRADLGEPIGMS